MKPKNKKQKGACENRTEHKTRSARNSGIKTGREESILHTQHRIIETGKQTRNGREGDRGYTIIGKAPGLGVHTPKCRAAVRPCGSFSERNILETQFNPVR